MNKMSDQISFHKHALKFAFAGPNVGLASLLLHFTVGNIALRKKAPAKVIY